MKILNCPMHDDLCYPAAARCLWKDFLKVVILNTPFFGGKKSTKKAGCLYNLISQTKSWIYFSYNYLWKAVFFFSFFLFCCFFDLFFLPFKGSGHANSNLAFLLILLSPYPMALIIAIRRTNALSQKNTLSSPCGSLRYSTAHLEAWLRGHHGRSGMHSIYPLRFDVVILYFSPWPVALLIIRRKQVFR